MRIAIGGIKQETCSFSHVRCDLEFFRTRGKVYWVDEHTMIPQMADTLTEIGGFIAAARTQEVEIIPTFAANSVSSGPLTAEALDYMTGRILDGIRAAGRLDGVFLAMHGGMMSESHPDATGYVIDCVRRLVGPHVSIGVSLDLHANPYPSWLEAADVIISYHTYPHLEQDRFDTAASVARLMFGQIRGEIRPTMALVKAPVVTHPEGQSTMGDGPLAQMEREVESLVAANEKLLDISLLPVQPWLNAPDIGFSILATTDNDPTLAREMARRFARQAWQRRREFDVEFHSPAEAIRLALATEGQPVVLSDPADGVGGGAAGDGTHVLRALLDVHPDAPVFLTCIDPDAVQRAIEAGFDSTVTLSIGGKQDTVYNQPVEVTGRVRAIIDGRFRSHGVQVSMGPCVVLEIGSIQLALISHTVHVVNPHVFRALGLEPLDAKIVLVKSPNHFREHFESIASRIILIDAPGVCSPNFLALPFREITRPLYPWDDDWEPDL
jgi:microcystin degradation protein MlrC